MIKCTIVMDDEDGQENYDSDHIDPEIEYRLYDAIFFDASSHPLRSENKTYLSDTVNKNIALDMIGVSEVVEVYKGASVDDSPSISTSCMDLMASKFTGSSVRITSFRDDSCSDSDSALRNISSTHKGYSKEPQGNLNVTIPDSEPDDDLTSHSSHSRSDDWTARDIVLGVSHSSRSSMCNIDDAVSVAKRLSKSGNDPSLWRICDADRTPSRILKNRYFKSSEDSVCYICRKRGHYASECTSAGPTCILCGEEGHLRDQCKEVYCYACLAPGHLKMECPLLGKLRRSVCKRCDQQGHCSSICPELWRQYRHTTKYGKPVELKPSLRHRGCCNCGRRGHCVDDCFRKPFRSNFLGPLPRRRVLVYDKRDIYKSARIRLRTDKKHLNKLGKRVKSSKRLKSKDKVNECQKQHRSNKKKKQPSDDHSYDSIEQSINQKLFNKVVEQELGGQSITLESDPNKISQTSSKSVSKLKRGKRRKTDSQSKAKIRKLASESQSFHTGQTSEWESLDSCSHPSFFYLSDDEPSRLYGSKDKHVHMDSSAIAQKNNKMRKCNTCPSLMCPDPNHVPLEKEKTKKIRPIGKKFKATGRQKTQKAKRKQKNRIDSPSSNIPPNLSSQLEKKQMSRVTLSAEKTSTSIDEIYQRNPNWLNFIMNDSTIESWDSVPFNSSSAKPPTAGRKGKRRKFNRNSTKNKMKNSRNTVPEQT